MGAKFSQAFSTNEHLNPNIDIKPEILFYYPIFGLESHVSALQALRLSQSSNIPLDTTVITPFVRPISKSFSNLELLQQYHEPVWQYLPYTKPSTNTTDIDNNDNLLTPHQTISINENPTHGDLLTELNKLPSKVVSRCFHAEVVEIDPIYNLRTKTVTKTIPSSTNNSNEDNVLSTTIPQQPILFLKFSPMTSTTNNSHIRLNDGILEDFNRITDSTAYTNNCIAIVHKIFPLYIAPLISLPIDYNQLYSQKDTKMIQLRQELLTTGQLSLIEAQQSSNNSNSNQQEEQQQKPEPIESFFELPDAHCIRIDFVGGRRIIDDMVQYEDALLAPIHNGTIIVIDFISEASVNEFYSSIYYMQDMILKGSTIQFTQVDLYIIGLNMHKLDSFCIEKEKVIRLCLDLGFTDDLIHLLPIVGERVYQRPTYESSSGKLITEYVGQSFTRLEYEHFSSVLWNKIWIQYFKTVQILEEQNLPPQPIQDQNIDFQQTSTITIQDPTFHSILKPSQWPLNTLRGFHILRKLETIKFQHIFQQSATTIERFLNKELTLDFHHRDVAQLWIRAVMYQYISTMNKYSQQYQQLLQSSQSSTTTNTPIFPFSQPSSTTPISIANSFPQQEYIIPTKITHVQKPQPFKLDYDLQTTIIKSDGNVNPEYFLSKEDNHSDRIEPPQFTSNQLSNDVNTNGIDNNTIIDINDNDIEQKHQFPGLPSQFYFDSFISIDDDPIICDPLGLFRIPYHQPFTISVSNTNNNNDNTNTTNNNTTISNITPKPKMINNNIPPFLHCVHTGRPDEIFPLTDVTKRYREKAYREVVDGPVAYQTSNIFGVITSHNASYGQDIRTYRPTTPPFLLNLEHSIKNCKVGMVTFCRDYVEYEHSFHTGGSDNADGGIQTAEPQQTINQQQNAQIQTDLSSTSATTTTTTSASTTDQLSKEQHESPQQQLLILKQKSNEHYNIRLHYTTQAVHHRFGHEFIYSNPKPLNRMCHSSQYNSTVHLLPLAFTHLIKIRPFIYIREYAPIYFQEYSPMIPELLLSHAELTIDLINRQIELRNQHFKTALDMISDVNFARESYQIPTTIEEEYDSYLQPNTIDLPIPSFAPVLKSPDDLFRIDDQSKPVDPQFLIDFHGNTVLQHGQLFQLGPNHFSNIDVFQQCPIHIVIFCYNPVVSNQTRVQLKQEAHNLFLQHLELNGQSQPLNPRPPFLNYLHTPMIEPITTDEYNYLKQAIPIIYKNEFMLKILPLSMLFSSLEKIEKQFIFHFVGMHEWPELFQQIQSNGVNQRIAFYRNNIMQHTDINNNK